MDLNTLQHSAILASAGSGKTYTLTNRFIYLLHHFEQPERIIALTFTRTAAGEFFQKIVDKLCTAAEDHTCAASLSRELSITADCARYRHLLKLLVQNMHRLNLQTLDSFFFRIVSAFTLELGLSGNLELLDEISAARTRNEARNQIVHRPKALGHELNEFWHAFKQATYGRDTRSVEKIVSQYTDQLYALYLDTPEAIYWGQVDAIWPNNCPWMTDRSPDWDQLADVLIAALPNDLTQSQKNDFDSAAKHLRNYGRDEKINTLLSNALAAAPDIFAGQATIKVRKEIQLSDTLCRALADSLQAIVWHHLRRALRNTQGVHRILQAYHQHYDRTTRRKGQLTFADLTHLLAPDSDSSPMGATDLATRQLMDFRLDGQFDHWLFDEFQDTSRPQWQVVANLIDEVIQDSSGQRSFFYVGDTKQCLYLWRNSDDRLFHDIQKQYNGDGETRIVQKPLSISWRSAPAIIDAVNTVFGDQSAIAETFFADAAARWARSWQIHEASSATRPLSGFACWLEAKKDESPTRNELILQLLNDLNPTERGLSVGLLVRKNTDANEIADYLRENCQLPIHNGSAVRPATDNAAGVALLALLQLAAHPGDTLARGYLNLIDTSTQGSELAKSAIALRERLFSESCESAVRWAAEQITAHLYKNDGWHRERLHQLVDQARTFDNEAHRDIDSLIQFLKASSTGDSQAESTVIIETIHKSKGLEYDVVIFVNEDKVSRSETDICALQNDQGKTDWILQPLRKELMQADPTLKQLLDQTTSQRDFGNLCTLYVAMTRAKRSLYMISDLKGAHRTSTVHFLKQILGNESQPTPLFSEKKTELPTSDAQHRTSDAELPTSNAQHSTSDIQQSPEFEVQSSTFNVQRSPEFHYPVLWSTGDPNWHETFKPSIPEPSPNVKPSKKSFPPAHPRLQLSRPSVQKSQRTPTAKHFELKQTAANFGTLVHDAFEQIEWFTELPEHPDNTVKQTLQNCFAQPDIHALFTKPSGQTAVWRERAFSYVEGDQFVNGVFDRVVINRDKNGAIDRAEIIDFKTDRIHQGNTLEQAIAHHRPQLQAYRTALAKIVGIDEAVIELKLLFTHVPQQVPL